MTQILLLGNQGQVGWELERSLAPLGEVHAFNHGALDLRDTEALRRIVAVHRPDIVVNAAAYTAVDRAETDIDAAMAINATAPGAIAELAGQAGALLVHYSTDYVFDGSKDEPYTEDDEPAPINAYGRSKLAGERAIRASGCRHLIFRTSWVYAARGANFLRTMQRLAAERSELRIVDDQFGAPTWARHIAQATALALARNIPDGLYHLTAGGSTTWYGFARAILERQGWGGRLVAIPSAEYPLPARRPANSVLSNAKFLAASGLAQPSWSQGLALCLAG